MELIEVRELKDPSLKVYKTLRESAFGDTNEFIADSPKVVNLLLETDIEVKSILASQEYYDANHTLLHGRGVEKLFVASKELMQSIVGHKIHHNCMMHGIRPKESALESFGNGVVMLDNLTSTENIGSIARCMAALGVGGYLIPKTSPHPYSRRSLRVSMGYMSGLKYKIYDDIAKEIRLLKTHGYRILAAEVSDDATFLRELQVPEKWVLIMGHEGKGIAQEILALCDEVVSIEMQEGVKSFNVAVAASLIMYKLSTLKENI